MTTALSNDLDSVSKGRRSDDLHELAVVLYNQLSSGHDDLAFNVDKPAMALTTVGRDGKRVPVRTGDFETAPPWQRCREVHEGAERDRRFNAWVLKAHLRGSYSVAPAAAGWVQWVCLDIDAHWWTLDAPEHAARRLAKAQADRVLAGVWRAFRCSATRQPIVLRTPSGGYHVWFPLTRDPTSTNGEHTWPAEFLRTRFERFLLSAGLEIAPGVLEVYPSGRCLRAPCGLGMAVLQAQRPDDPDDLRWTPWPDTMAAKQLVDWEGRRKELSVPVRRIVPMARAFVEQFESQRRTPSDWLGSESEQWDPTWGPLVWRTEDVLAAENLEGANAALLTPSQESDDVPGGTLVRSPIQRSGRPSHRAKPTRAGRLSPRSTKETATPLTDDLPPEPVAAVVVRGRAFKEKVRRLLLDGVTVPATRHDAVLTLAYYWGATCGLSSGQALERLEAWCRAHEHRGSQLGARPKQLLATCRREAAHYLDHHAARWRFRGSGDGGGLGTLTPADREIVAAADPRVRDEVSAILAWLAARANAVGIVADPVQIASGLLARICGDRRVVEGDRRRRATTIALEELVRLGLLTMDRNYVVGQRGRSWCCWYVFGSGQLPRVETVSTARWAELGPTSVSASASAANSNDARRDAADADTSPASTVEVRVVGERETPEGTVRVLSDGSRATPRTMLSPAPTVESPTATYAYRPPWWARRIERRVFTPGELLLAPVLVTLPPDVSVRKRMTRRERLEAGGGGGDGSPPSLLPIANANALIDGISGATIDVGNDATTGLARVRDPSTPGDDGSSATTRSAHAELVTEVGAAAADLPADLVDVVARAWRRFRRRE